MRDHRARDRLEVHGHPRRADRARGRPGHEDVRAAARLVLLLPLLPAPDLQVAGLGDPGHGRDPDDRSDPAARAAVHRPQHGAAAVAPPGRDRGRGADRARDGRPHLQGRGREGADRERDRGGRPELGRRSRASRTTRRRSPARSCSPSRAARTATPTSARAARTSARPTSPASRARRARASSSRSTTSSARAASTRARRCRRSRRSARTTCTSSPSSSRPRRARASCWLPCASSSGITGASGAPYAARLLEALAGADCEVGLCASRAGVEVLATELYGDARLSRRRDARAADRARARARSRSTTSATGTRPTRAARPRSTPT